MKSFARFLLPAVLAGAASAPAQVQPAAPPPPQAVALPASGRPGPGGSVAVAEQAVPGTTTSVNTLNPSVQTSGPYVGSSAGTAAMPFSGRLSLEEAVRRGLAFNLGAIGLATAVAQTGAQVGVARSVLLPNLNGALSETVEQVDLAALGFRFSAPGLRLPTVVGPFNFISLQVSLSQVVANLTAVNNYRAARATARAGRYSLLDARDLVVLGVGGAYLQVQAAQARLDAAKSQLATAEAIFHQATEQHAHGVLGRLNVDQSQVRLLTEQQRVITLRNELAKQKINLARMIGLPPNPAYTLTDSFAFSPAPVRDLEEAVRAAGERRADLKAAESQVQAAERALAAARAERLPGLGVTADYQRIGVNPGQQNGAYAAVATLSIPVWQGGRVGSDIAQARAVLAQRQAELADTRSQVEAQVRQAYLDLEAAAGQVAVARRNLDVTREALDMTRARMAAGVVNTVEVVQAQESLAAANLDLINSIFAHNLAKLNLARSLGDAAAQLPSLLKPAPSLK